MSEFEQLLNDEEENDEEEERNERFWEIVDMYENGYIDYDKAVDMLYELNNHDEDETQADLELLDRHLFERQKGN